MLPENILADARLYLHDFLEGKENPFEVRHPWRKEWQFAVLHSLHVEVYVQKILSCSPHPLSEHEVLLLRLAAILHDIERMGPRETHAQRGAEIAEKWLQTRLCDALTENDVAKIVAMIAAHSNKAMSESDFSNAVLKDADTLDEIGVMSIFMTGNWLEKASPFFFHQLRQRLIDFELPFCDRKLAILNTDGARKLLREKKKFIEGFIAQLTDELDADPQIETMLLDFSGK